MVLDENSQLEAAIDTYRQVIALKPDYVEAYSNLGVILLKDDRAAEAIEVYQRAIEIKPDWATLHNNLGQALLNKNPDRAIASYLTAIELEPTWFWLTTIWGKLGKYRGSIRGCCLFRSRDRAEPRAYFGLYRRRVFFDGFGENC